MYTCSIISESHLNLPFNFRYGRAQDVPGPSEATLKAIYKQLVSKQEEIDNLREKMESMKTLQQEVTYLSAALHVNSHLIIII